MNPIRLEMTVYEIIQKHPETLAIFKAYGFESFADEKLLEKLGPFLKLKSALKTRQINPDLFIHLLGTKVEEARREKGKIATLNYSQQGELNLLGLLPCPLKIPLQEALELFLQDSNLSLTYCLEGNANNQLSYYDYVQHFQEIDELPDLIISPGLNSFFYRDFFNKFLKTGCFTDIIDYPLNPQLAELGFQDPNGHYNMLAMNLSIIVVDHTKLDNLPIPKSWEDLLQPQFARQVTIRGSGSFFCETLLLNIYQDYGFQGLRNLGRSVKNACHPAEMVKCAGSNRGDGTAISIMPLFFAQTIKNKDQVSIIWPKEGAIVSPVSMLVKTAKVKQLQEIIQFFTGPLVGQICADACFPSIHPTVDNKLPPGAKLKWLGWDYLQAQDLESLMRELTKNFLATYQGG